MNLTGLSPYSIVLTVLVSAIIRQDQENESGPKFRSITIAIPIDRGPTDWTWDQIIPNPL
jgi:hypothetical protein